MTKPYVSLRARGAGWDCRLARACSKCPWTSRSVHRVLGFRTFRPLRVILGGGPQDPEEG